MFDLTYKNLKYVSVTNTTTTGDAEKLAELVQEWDAVSCPENCDVSPDFDVMAGSEFFTVTTDTMDPDEDGSDKACWTCRVDLSQLDWTHPWNSEAIMAAETVYHQRVTKEQLERNAALYVRSCAHEGWVSTPKDADAIVCVFLEWLIGEAEDMDPDPVAALLSEAMEDARPIGTGIPRLDAALGGGLHVGLSILSGSPSAGKTSLAIWLSLYAANQQDGRVIYDMVDMGGKQSAALRMISCAAVIAGVDGCELGRASEWDAREVYEGREAFDRVAKGRIELTEQADISELISWLDYLVRTAGRIGFVVVDFAQTTSWEGRELAFDTEAASLAVRSLRLWAHAHNAVVLLLSAFSKGASEAHARGAAPSMTDILGSAELAYSAEHILTLVNAHDGGGNVELRDLKHRHAGNAAQADRACTLLLDGEHGCFT